MKYRHFTEKEVNGLEIVLVMHLDDARDFSKTPFIIVSGKRSPQENASVGGVENSAHLRGLAVDLRAHTNEQRYQIVSSLLNVGFCRIGIYSDHIHADMDASLPQNVIWQE